MTHTTASAAAWSAGVSRPDERLEISPSACDARANRADRTTRDDGRLLVTETDELGEHERISPVRVERGEQIVGDLRRPLDEGHDLVPHPLHQSPAPLAAPDVIGTRATGDRQQPQPDRRVTSEAGQRLQRPQIRLLHEILGLTGRSQRRAQLPDRRLRAADELGDRHVVALDRRRSQAGELVVVEHVSMMADDQCGPGTNRERRATCADVRCERWRDAISARADGEDPGVSPNLLDAHLAACAACREFAGATERALQFVGRVEPGPDLSRQVARLAAIRDRAGTSTIVRGLLAVVAVEILVFSLPELVSGEREDATGHSVRHLGAFTVAYAVGLLVVVVRPARARAMLPVAAVLTGALLVTAIVGLADRRVPLADEALHLPEVISVVLIWLIAVPHPGRRRGIERRPAERPELRIVRPDRRAG